jgi:hypothetical protein
MTRSTIYLASNSGIVSDLIENYSKTVQVVNFIQCGSVLMITSYHLPLQSMLRILI